MKTKCLKVFKVHLKTCLKGHVQDIKDIISDFFFFFERKQTLVKILLIKLCYFLIATIDGESQYNINYATKHIVLSWNGDFYFII